MKILCVMATVSCAGALAACSGNATLQPPAAGAPAAVRKSWMLPEARGHNLLYVSSSEYQYSNVYVYTFPKLKLVGGIVAGNYAAGLCSNADGDVFVTGGYNIEEYRHASARRVATISDTLGDSACSVNPTNGDLAATGYGGLTILRPGKGFQWHLGQLFALSNLESISCAYDGSGNLFLDGTRFVSSSLEQFFYELPNGGKRFENITLDVSLATPGNLFWDDRYLAVGDNDNLLIHRFAISGSQGTQVGQVTLKGVQEIRTFSIRGGILIGPAFESTWLFGLWRYPQGGSVGHVTDQNQAYGATISVAPPK